MLSFMVAASPNGTSAASAPTWRTSVASIVTGSNDLVTVDDTGIWFRGQRWLSIVTNVLDLRRQKGEMPLRLLARGDTGRFSLVSLPERVRNVLREGLRLTISEDVHRLAIPTSTLLQMTSARDGVKSRFGTVDFAIQGDELNALQDFASRLAPIESRGDGVRLQAPTPSSSDSAKSASIPAGTEIEMASSSRECTDSVRLGDQFGATVTKPVATSAGALLDAGTPVRLMISDLKQGTHPADPVDARMSAVSVTLAGHEYALAGTIVRYTKVRQPDSSGFCVPKNGALVLRLRRPFELP
jgi:hypothetical protein